MNSRMTESKSVALTSLATPAHFNLGGLPKHLRYSVTGMQDLTESILKERHSFFSVSKARMHS